MYVYYYYHIIITFCYQFRKFQERNYKLYIVQAFN